MMVARSVTAWLRAMVHVSLIRAPINLRRQIGMALSPTYAFRCEPNTVS